jgi:predicted MFS family arabinose efflux permease
MNTTETALSPDANGSPTIRTWLGVFSLALGAALLVTTEFIPVGFLPSVASELNVTLGAAGLMVLVPGLSAAVAAPLIIVVAGRLDRRYLIVALGALVLLSNGVAAIAPNFAVLLIARIFLGVAIGGFWGVVPALGFRLAGEAAGTRATSFIMAGVSAGTVVGLPAGQFFGNLVGWRLTFAGAAAIAALVVVAQLATLPKIPPIGTMRFVHLGRALRVPIARTGFIAAAISFIGQFAASTFVTPFLLQDVHMEPAMATLVFLGYGAAGIAGTLLGSALVARSRIWTFVAAAVAFGVILVFLPLLSGAPVIVAILFVAWGLIWGLVPLALQTLLLSATPEMPEASSALLVTVMQLSIAIGAALGGILVDSAGLTTVFVVGGALAVAASIFGALARKGV